MRDQWRERFFRAALALAVAAAMSLAGAVFCPAADRTAGEPPAKPRTEKSKRVKKSPAKPQSASLLRGGYDPTTPPNPETDLKNRIKPPVQSAQPGAPGSGYQVGGKLQLAPGKTPVPGAGVDVAGSRSFWRNPDDAPVGGGVRAMWQSRGNMAVSGGVGYDAAGRAGTGSPWTAGPNEKGPPGPAAGVLLKYSF
ncbi:MAG: hypothetical protein HQK81_13845 [Desulfovibrionaceae bacterium]|nr:hypothetical protein [Desulfovibrionaceae bacterium]MBF0515126.1 hypothetical protein [Desulfovibrionaceae bacterium]